MSGSFESVDSYNSLKLNKIEFDDNTNHIAQNSGDLTITADANFVVDASTNIELNADGGTVTVKDAGATLLTFDSAGIANGSGDFALNVAGDITLDADGGDVFFKDDSLTGDNFLQFKGFDTGGGGIAGVISSSLGDMMLVTNQTAFTFVKGAVDFGDPGSEDIFEINHGTNKVELKVGILNVSRVRLEIDDTQSGGDYSTEGCVSDLSGSLLLDNGHVAGEIRFQEAGVGNNYMGFKAPDSVTADKVFTLPDGHPGSNNSALVSATSGVLSYVTVSGATSKGVKVLAAGISAGSDVNFNAVDAGDTISGMATNTQDSSVDVFVNGQLLLSGSEDERSAGTKDFRIKSSTVLTFAFDLEIDDIVQVIKRG